MNKLAFKEYIQFLNNYESKTLDELVEFINKC